VSLRVVIFDGSTYDRAIQIAEKFFTR
jgi:hypothetical protein